MFKPAACAKKKAGEVCKAAIHPKGWVAIFVGLRQRIQKNQPPKPGGIFIGLYLMRGEHVKGRNYCSHPRMRQEAGARAQVRGAGAALSGG
jgi:hypothetical protein